MVDVAREAGVSLKTVSRVVNEESGVRPETARRVRRVIERLGFQRNDSASQLRRGSSASIGLVVEDLGNPFYSQLAAAVEREARREGHLLISASAEGDPEREAALVAALVARQVDGLVVVPAGLAGAGHRTWGAPVVYVDRPGADVSSDTVLSDNVGGVRSAVEHLAARGHRRIGFLGDDPAYWTAQERERAFRATHADLRLDGEQAVAMGPHTPDSLSAVLTAWTSGPDPVTALVTGNNRVTVAMLRAIRKLDAPLAFVGYDDFELADLLEPAVTVVHQDPGAMGRAAARQLFARINGDDGPPRSVTVPTRLVVRASGAMRMPTQASA
jgi:LacI family transcriptional regulator